MKKIGLTFLLILGSLLSIYAQYTQKTLQGKVVSTDGDPLPGASILVVGHGRGAIANADGEFTVSAPHNATYLQVSIIGFKPKTINITNATTYEIVLELSDISLDELVITGGGALVKKRELGTANTTINSVQVTQGKASNLAASLSGKVAGLQVNAVNGGINPNYRLVLRGQRSITGNNQALLVLDNLIVPNSLLGNLNPEDIDDIQVLNGPAAAAAYGSDASNGAIVITTKRGTKGRSKVRFSNTTTFEKVSFLPQLQNRFGSGTTPDAIKTYNPYENQQYGPKFDGSVVQIGKPLEDGSIQTVPYSATNDKNDFWETGLANQTDFSIQSGDDKSSYYIAAQYFKQKSTVPKDEYERISVRANGSRQVFRNFKVDYGANYIQNDYDQNSVTSSMYNEILQTPAHIPLTSYSNWKNDPYSNPNGYYNEYYDNPYFSIDNWRNTTGNTYFQGNLALVYNPIRKVTLTYRAGISSSNASSKNTVNKFTFTDYTKSISGSAKTDVAGSVGDSQSKSSQLVTEAIAEYRTNITKDLEFYVLGGGYLRSNSSSGTSISSTGLVIADFFNVSNTQNNYGGSASISESRQVALRGEVKLGFRDYLFLHVTGRNDWSSVLEKSNRSFFYPSATLSFVLTDAFPNLKSPNGLSLLKVRGAYAYVGNVNLGAYALNTTFAQAAGYPYGGNAGFSVGGTLVAQNLKPEITKGPEFGFDFAAYQSKISGGVTYYKTNTFNQTLTTSISQASGYSSLRMNVGEVSNVGLETFLKYNVLQTKSGLTVNLGANYAYNRNKVLSISDESNTLNLSSGGGGLVVAEVGQPFPLIKTTNYARDDQGRIIVNRNSGFPSFDGSYTVKGVSNPPHILGADLEILYKGIRFSTLFEYRGGNYTLNTGSVGFDFAGSGIRTAWYNRERFVVPNSSYWDDELNAYVANTDVSVRSGGADFWTDATRNRGVGENYVYSAAFWKLREAVISYEVPVGKLSKGKVQSATVSAQGRNLFIWVPKTNIYSDPEYSAAGSGSNAVGFNSLAQTPPARYFGGTLTVIF